MKDYAVEDLNNTLDEEILKNYQEQMKIAFNKYSFPFKSIIFNKSVTYSAILHLLLRSYN